MFGCCCCCCCKQAGFHLGLPGHPEPPPPTPVPRAVRPRDTRYSWVLYLNSVDVDCGGCYCMCVAGVMLWWGQGWRSGPARGWAPPPLLPPPPLQHHEALPHHASPPTAPHHHRSRHHHHPHHSRSPAQLWWQLWPGVHSQGAHHRCIYRVQFVIFFFFFLFIYIYIFFWGGGRSADRHHQHQHFAIWKWHQGTLYDLNPVLSSPVYVLWGWGVGVSRVVSWSFET